VKAYSLENINNLKYKEIDKPNCLDGWVLVKVKAAGICSSDIPRIFKKGTYHFPTIPGHEFSGIVDEVGAGVDRNLLGKSVGVFPLIPCKECEQCKNKHYEMCSNYDYIGSRRDGGFSEFVAVPEWNLIELPSDISFTDAAMLEPLAVALHAMKQGGDISGKKVAIIGTGMIGFAAAQWANKMGAQMVTVIGRSHKKEELAKNVNVDYTTLDNVNCEYDVVLEAVGSNSSIDLAINIVKAAGTLIVMGNPEGNIVLKQNTYWRILRKQLHLVGTWNSAYENGKKSDWSEVIEALHHNEIKVDNLISHIFQQEKLVEGLELMREHKEPYCKVMTVWNEEHSCNSEITSIE